MVPPGRTVPLAMLSAGFSMMVKVPDCEGDATEATVTVTVLAVVILAGA